MDPHKQTLTVTIVYIEKFDVEAADTIRFGNLLTLGTGTRIPEYPGTRIPE